MKKFSLITNIVIFSFLFIFYSQAKDVGKENSKMKAGNLSTHEAMEMCNKTYSIKLDYLQELNDTGSFPDESEKTSMCFMKCYLEAIGVMNSEHKVDKEKTLVMYKLDDDEVIDECSNEVSAVSITDECEKSYFFIRCIMQRSLLEHLGEDNDSVK